MEWFRRHWFDMGPGLAVLVVAFVLYARPDTIGMLLWLNLAALFLHQVEEYCWPGGFPGMMNRVMFKSAWPDRYPLNARTALVVNVGMGWAFYFLAACFGMQAIWLGIATMMVSAGNIVAHVFLFNIKGKSWYNPGMATALLFFLPLVAAFVYCAGGLITPMEWVAGVALGIALNYVGILKIIDWMKDENSPYGFNL